MGNSATHATRGWQQQRRSKSKVAATAIRRCEQNPNGQQDSLWLIWVFHVHFWFLSEGFHMSVDTCRLQLNRLTLAMAGGSVCTHFLRQKQCNLQSSGVTHATDEERKLPFSGRHTTEQMVTSCHHPSVGLIDHIDHRLLLFFCVCRLEKKKYGYFLQWNWNHAAL